jgi:hypothetical protein
MSNAVYLLICTNWGDTKQPYSVVGTFSTFELAEAVANDPDIMEHYDADLYGDAGNSFEIYAQVLNPTVGMILAPDEI